MGFVRSPEEVARIQRVLQRPRFVGAEMLTIDFMTSTNRRAVDISVKLMTIPSAPLRSSSVCPERTATPGPELIQ